MTTQLGETSRSEDTQEEERHTDTYHTPAVAPHQINTVIKHCTAGATATLQDGGLENVPLVTFRVIALHEHDVKVGET